MSTRAIRAEIHNRGLDPTKKYVITDKSGKLVRHHHKDVEHKVQEPVFVPPPPVVEQVLVQEEQLAAVVPGLVSLQVNDSDEVSSEAQPEEVQSVVEDVEASEAKTVPPPKQNKKRKF